MSSLGKTVFMGASGKQYQFRVFALGTRFRKLSGVYAVIGPASNGDGAHQHVVLYVGQNEDLSRPFARHRKAKDFRHYGADRVCLLSDDSEESRRAKRQDLVAAYHPVCND
jgi:hypothetical protein